MKDKIITAIHEVCIIGGGPAGVATALSLQQRGIHSTIIEAAGAARPKVGETLPPAVQPILRALGARHLLDDPRHLPCYGNAYLWGNDSVREKHFFMHTGGHGWHLRRDCFEADLLRLAEQKGTACISDCKLMQAVFDDTTGLWQLQVKTGDHEETTLRYPFVVDATGRSNKLARCLGIGRRQYDTLAGIVARFPVGDIRLSQLTHIEAVEHGWWYAAAVADGEVVTAFMTDAGMLDKYLQHLPGYWSALQQTHLIRTLFPEDYHPAVDISLHTQSAGTSCLTETCGKHWLAVGDAAFAYDPVSSYGITSALGSGCYAGNAIADHFAGAEEALPAYRYVTEKAFADYLPMWQHQYAQERRWGGEFWGGR